MKTKNRRKSKNVEDMRSSTANRIQYVSEGRKEKWSPTNISSFESTRAIPKKVFGFDEKDMEDSIARLHKAAKKGSRIPKK